MFTVTLSKGKGGEEEGTRIHIHWHVNIQADGIGPGGSASLPHKLGISLGHKTEISILGSKQRLNLQGQHASLAGEGGVPVDPGEAQPSQKVHSPALAGDSSRGEGKGSPKNGRGFPHGHPPTLILPWPLSQFAH